MRFRTTVELGGKTATGLRVPADVVEALGTPTARPRDDRRAHLPQHRRRLRRRVHAPAQRREPRRGRRRRGRRGRRRPGARRRAPLGGGPAGLRRGSRRPRLDARRFLDRSRTANDAGSCSASRTRRPRRHGCVGSPPRSTGWRRAAASAEGRPRARTHARDPDHAAAYETGLPPPSPPPLPLPSPPRARRATIASSVTIRAEDEHAAVRPRERTKTAGRPSDLADEPAEERADRLAPPGEEPVAGVHPPEQRVRDDPLAQRDRDHVPHDDRQPRTRRTQPRPARRWP